MRRSDLWRMALRGWRRLFFPGLLFLIAAVCLGGNAAREGWTVYQEQQEPCRLMGTVTKPVNDISAIAEIDGVLNGSVVYPVNVIISANGTSQDLELTGIDAAMVKGEWAAGGIYPETSAMPYLVVNEAALRRLSDAEEAPIAAAEWINRTVELTVDTENPVAAKICGVLRDETKQAPPVAYVSLQMAKTLLQQKGEAVSSNTVWLDLQNAGVAAGVEAQLSQLGMSAENTNADREVRWTLLNTKRNREALAAGIALVASVALFSEKLRLDHAVHYTEYVHLETMGLGTADQSMNQIRWAVFLLAGLLAGLCVFICLPIFYEMLQLRAGVS